MPYRFLTARPVAGELRRIATEQVDRATSEIEDHELDLHATVHQVRKRCKKVRGLLRLVRGCFAAYGDENAAFRDAARRLSGIRDAEAHLEAWDALMGCYREGGLEDELQRRVRGRLEEEKRRLAGELDLEDRLREFARTMAEARRRIAEWSLEPEGFEAFDAGLQKTYRRGRERHREARGRPDSELLHEWRKRVKYHWYHTRLLEEAWPEVMETRADASKHLADLLGDHHDLENLETALTESPEIAGSEDTLRLASALIVHRRRQLRQRARLLGERLFVERPKHLCRRLRCYWRARHREAELEGPEGFPPPS